MDFQSIQSVYSAKVMIGTEAKPAEFSESQRDIATVAAPTFDIHKLSNDFLPGGAKWDETRDRWLKALDADALASVYLHPDLIFSNYRDKAAPVIFAKSKSCGDLASLVVLRADDRRLRVIPRLPIYLTIRRRKIAACGGIGILDETGALEFVRAMVDLLIHGQADELCIDDLVVDGPLWKALKQIDHPRIYLAQTCAPQPHRSIHFPATAEDYWKSLCSHDRKVLKKKVSKLEHSVRCYRKPEEVAEFLEKAHVISQKTWQTNSQHPQIINSAGERSYWNTVASLGAMRSYILEHKGHAVAFLLGIQWKGQFISEEMGYDPAIADLSPGSVLTFRIIEDLLANDRPTIWDFGFGDNQYKRIVGNHETMSGPISVVRRAIRPMTVTRLMQFRQWIGCKGRSAAKRLGLTTWARHTYRKVVKST